MKFGKNSVYPGKHKILQVIFKSIHERYDSIAPNSQKSVSDNPEHAVLKKLQQSTA